MNVGDKFRIKNEVGIMDIVIKERIDNCIAKLSGFSFSGDVKVRWEFHNDGCFGLISTLYCDSEKNRDIYVAEYESGILNYYKGFIEKFERENTTVYQTL